MEEEYDNISSEVIVEEKELEIEEEEGIIEEKELEIEEEEGIIEEKELEIEGEVAAEEEEEEEEGEGFPLGPIDQEKIKKYLTCLRNIRIINKEISKEYRTIRGEISQGPSEIEKCSLKIFNELEQKFKDKPAGVNDGVVYGIVSVKNNIQWLEYYTEPNNIAAYKVFNLDDIMVRIGYMKEADFVLGYLKHLNNDGKLKTWTVYENKDDICLLVSLVN